MTPTDVRGEDYEAARPVPARSGVTGDPWVREHLPECGYGIELSFDGVVQPTEPCCCDRLRACEQRVLNTDQFVKAHMEGKRVGFTLGRQAARDAVAGLRPIYYHGKRVGDCVKRDDALAAIDALKEGK